MKKNNIPLASNVSKSVPEKKAQKQKPKFIKENEATEQKLAEIFELGYDSDGELPFFGNVE